MERTVIDFHTHPFSRPEDSICLYADHWTLTAEGIPGDLAAAGISRFCGSVIRTRESVAAALGVAPGDLSWWDVIHCCNQDMLELWARFGESYIPGMMVHPDYVAQSLAEMETLHSQGVRLIGELVPYYHGWTDYACPGFSRLLDGAQELGMVVNIHSLGMDQDGMDAMARAHPGCSIVFAHPGQREAVARHVARLKGRENFYLDLSGTGLYRHGVLRALLDQVGRDKLLFGTDYPVCNPYMYVGGVELDPQLTREEKDAVLCGNARRLLKL